MERGSRVGPGVTALPGSTTIRLSPEASTDETPLLSITWKGIEVKKVRMPVSSLHRHSSWSH
jgi:hypothetical protein